MIGKIAIFGDSWSFSSFKKNSNFYESLDHTTFQSLFAKEKNIYVDNFSKQGGTNLDTLKLTKMYNDYDLLIVFQTDPIRQCVRERSDPLVIKENLLLPEAKHFKELCELLLRDFYLELAQNKTPILLVGGCSKICFEHVPASIRTLPFSWTELMIDGFEDNYYYWTEPTLLLYNHARKKLGWNSTLPDFFEFEKLISSKNHIWHTSDNFSWCHAAEPAYKKMFEKLTEVIHDNSQTSNRQAVLDTQAG